MKLIAATLIGSIHVLAAVILVGGAIFSTFVFRPASGQLDPPSMGKVRGLVGMTFTKVVWWAIAILLFTGILRAAAMGALAPNVLFGSLYGKILLAKIVLFAVAIFFVVLITKSGMKMAQMSKDGTDPKLMAEMDNKLGGYAKYAGILGILIIVLAVGLRAVGVPH